MQRSGASLGLRMWRRCAFVFVPDRLFKMADEGSASGEESEGEGEPSGEKAKAKAHKRLQLKKKVSS